MMDISTGERYIYATIMLYCLLVTYGLRVLFFWYDINCKFGGYFKRWAQAYGQVQEALRGLRFPLPCFHRYCHRWVGGPLPPLQARRPCMHMSRKLCMLGSLSVAPHPCPLPFSAACQERNDGMYMEGAGRQYNEPLETLWAYLGPLGVTTQVGCRQGKTTMCREAW